MNILPAYLLFIFCPLLANAQDQGKSGDSSAKVHYESGIRAYRAGNGKLALEQLQKAVELAPDSYDAGKDFALILTELKYFKEAAEQADLLMEKFPGVARPFMIGGFANLLSEQPEKAAVCYEKALELMDLKALPMRGVASSYFKANNKEKAAESSKALREHLVKTLGKEKAVEQLFDWAGEHFRAERFDLSFREMDQALRVDPEADWVRLDRARSAVGLKMKGLAESDLKNLEKKNYELTEVKFLRGVMAGQEGNHAEAIKFYDEVIKLNPTHKTAYHNRAFSRMRNGGDLDLALADALKQTEISREEEKNWQMLAVIYEERKDGENAFKTYSRMADPPLNSVIGLNKRALHFANSERYHLAIKDWSKVLELKPRDAQTYRNLSYVFAKMKEFKKGVAAGTRAIELNPNDTLSYANRSLNYTGLGMAKEAAADQKKAQELKELGK